MESSYWIVGRVSDKPRVEPIRSVKAKQTHKDGTPSPAHCCAWRKAESLVFWAMILIVEDWRVRGIGLVAPDSLGARYCT